MLMEEDVPSALPQFPVKKTQNSTKDNVMCNTV